MRKKIVLTLFTSVVLGLLVSPLFYNLSHVKKVDAMSVACYETVPATETTYLYTDKVTTDATWGDWTDGNKHGNGVMEERTGCPISDTNYNSIDWRKDCSRYLDHPIHRTRYSNKIKQHRHQLTPSVTACPVGYSEYEDTCRKVDVEGIPEHQVEVECPTVTPTPTNIPEQDVCPNDDGIQTSLDECTIEDVGDTTPEVVVTQVEKPQHFYWMDAQGAPQCTDLDTIKLPANVHVIRTKGETTALVNWFQTEGNSANIYFKEITSNKWEHADRDIDVRTSYVSNKINFLKADAEYIFAVQQKNGCGGGQLVIARPWFR